MKKLSLMLVFVLAFVMLFAFNAFAKNITDEADFTMASGGDLCKPEYVVDNNYFTAASNGNASDWVDYYFNYETGRNITKIRVIYNSIGENMGVCTYDEISTYGNEIICRVKNSAGTQIELKSKDATVVYNAEGKAIYSYIDFVPADGAASWEDIVYINIPTIHNKDEKTCIWEIDVYDDQECTDDTHEFQCYGCDTKVACNACGQETEEVSHPYLPATCIAPKTCVLCDATEGEVGTIHTPQGDDGDCSTPVRCAVCDEIVTPAYIHRFNAETKLCTNDGCTVSATETNIAGLATITSSPDGWWATATKYLVDGDWTTACHAPKSAGFSYIFTYEEVQYLTRFVIALNGDFTAPAAGTSGSSDAIKTVSIELMDEYGFSVYESEELTLGDVTEVEFKLPYAYQAKQVVVKFSSSEQWGNSFVREIEIYKPDSLETNISANSTITTSPAGWWACNPKYIVDGDWTTACHSPKSGGFSYIFSYGSQKLISKVVVVANGQCSTPAAGGSANNTAIKNVTIELQDKDGFTVYETEAVAFDGATEVEIVLPYTYYASKVIAKFSSSEQWGSSFVREVEIYETVVPNFADAEEGFEPLEGCWERVKFTDYISKYYYVDGDGRGDWYYVCDEDGNRILDEKGNAIMYAGVPIGGNTNPFGSELDGNNSSGLGIYYERSENRLQYNFSEKLLVGEITIGFNAGGNGNDGYELWIGNVVDGEEVWTQVVDFTAPEKNAFSETTFTLGENSEGVEGTMFRFCWRPYQAMRLTPSLTEIDMKTYKSTCDWTENEVLVEGNCGYDRQAECTCSVCGLEKVVVTPASGEHDKSIIEEAKAATCTDFGYNAVKKCAICEKTFGGDRIAKSLGGHDMSVAATCTSGKGCSRCDYTEGDPLGHKMTDATCSAPATCSVCGATEGEALGHTPVGEGIVTEATCTEDGYTTYTCSVCGESYNTDVVEATGHIEEVFDAEPPTCEAPGMSEEIACGVCGEIIKAAEEIPALGHTNEVLPAVDATCTTTGLTAGVKCSVCDTILIAQEVIPYAHTWSETPEAIEPATCVSKGMGKFYCTSCWVYADEEIELPIDKTNHMNTEWNAGWTKTTCLDCGEITFYGMHGGIDNDYTFYFMGGFVNIYDNTTDEYYVFTQSVSESGVATLVLAADPDRETLATLFVGVEVTVSENEDGSLYITFVKDGTTYAFGTDPNAIVPDVIDNSALNGVYAYYDIGGTVQFKVEFEDGTIYVLEDNMMLGLPESFSYTYNVTQNTIDTGDYGYFYVDGGNLYFGRGWLLTPVEGEEPDEPDVPEVNYGDKIGSITVTTENTYGYNILGEEVTNETYKYTAENAGQYAFYVPAGLGLWSVESFNNWGNPEIDFYANEAGYYLVVNLEAGAEYEFTVGATTAEDWTIDIYFEAPAHVHTEVAIPAILPTPSTVGYTAGLVCSECGEVTKAPIQINVTEMEDTKDPAFRIAAANLSLQENISVNYWAVLSEGYKASHMVFVFNGYEYIVTDYTINETNGRYGYKFDQTFPEYMGDNIEAYVYAETAEGEFSMNKILEYSVMQYCINQLKKADAAFTTVISDVLVLGAKTQVYQNYKVNSLVTDLVAAQGYTLTPTVFESIDASLNKQTAVGEKSEVADWKSGSLLMGSSTEVALKFVAADVDNVTVKVNFAGEDKYFTAKDFTLDEETGYYVVTLNYIKSYQYDEAITATFEVNGEQIGRTLTYSVDSYLYRNAEKESHAEASRDLMKALFVYGESIAAYFA